MYIFFDDICNCYSTMLFNEKLKKKLKQNHVQLTNSPICLHSRKKSPKTRPPTSTSTQFKITPKS